MNVYARDSLAPALRELERMLAKVRAGNFQMVPWKGPKSLGECSQTQRALTRPSSSKADSLTST
eukprot:4560068-Amphidinium_carterae.1